MIRFFYFLPVFLLCACGGPKSAQPKVAAMQTVSQHQAAHNLAAQYRYATIGQYLTIKEVNYNQEGQKVTFLLSWQGSWRQDSAFDAAWIFAKAKGQDGTWYHLPITALKAATPSNKAIKAVPAMVKVAPQGVGAMVYRAENGAGPNHWQMELDLAQPATAIAPVQVQVFGLEMVHVAPGAFELGTLKAEKDRREVLTPGAGGAPYNPFFTYSQLAKGNYGGVYKVATEAPITIGKQEGALFWQDAVIPGTNTFSGVPKGILGPRFPKGVRGFFQMKYELSQQEYCHFLNTLTPAQQAARDISGVQEFNRPIADYRNNIVKVNGVFSTNRPHRPCNFISWKDGLAFADWAGLRHMTELEFEKACRGPEPAVYREYVWGVNEIRKSQNMQFATSLLTGKNLAQEESGQEVIDGNLHASMYSYKNYIDVCTPQGNFYDPDSRGCRNFKGGDGGRGPVRKGIFGATATGNRIKAGATYYGAMEMGGNLQEPVVTVGHPSGRKFEGSHGNGELNALGEADNPDWLPANNDYAFAGRGGCWMFHENHARTADRFKGLRTNPNRRASHIGFRGVRTAW